MVRVRDNNSPMRPCPACGETSARALGARNGFELVRCARCATVYTAALPSHEAEAHDYESYYHAGNLSVPGFVESRLDELVAEFDPSRDRNRWLDIGCGAGTLIQAAARAGWDATGTEIAPPAVEALTAQGLDVRLGELGELDLEREGFDVVSAVEVLEHVADPAELISAAAGLIRPGGVLYLTTPHGRGISARLLGSGWSVMCPPEHLQLFSIAGLRACLSGAGLRLERLQSHAVNPRELLTALRRDRGLADAERVESSYRINEALSENRAGRAAKSGVNALLNAVRLGDTLKATARKPA